MDRANVLLFVLAGAGAVLTVTVGFKEYHLFPMNCFILTAGITCVYRAVLVWCELMAHGVRVMFRTTTEGPKRPR